MLLYIYICVAYIYIYVYIRVYIYTDYVRPVPDWKQHTITTEPWDSIRYLMTRADAIKLLVTSSTRMIVADEKTLVNRAIALPAKQCMLPANSAGNWECIVWQKERQMTFLAPQFWDDFWTLQHVCWSHPPRMSCSPAQLGTNQLGRSKTSLLSRRPCPLDPGLCGPQRKTTFFVSDSCSKYNHRS